MAVATGFDASLDAVEMDLLCTFAGVPAPIPLRVPSAGRTHTERAELFRAARERMTRRGLADERGPEQLHPLGLGPPGRGHPQRNRRGHPGERAQQIHLDRVQRRVEPGSHGH